MEHLRSMTGDPDILYKHTANYAAQLAAAKNDIVTYVAMLDEPEEDEAAAGGGDGEEGGGAGAEDPAAAAAEGDEAAAAPGIDYSDRFFRYVAAAGRKGANEFLVGKTLPRGTGASYPLVAGPHRSCHATPSSTFQTLVLSRVKFNHMTWRALSVRPKVVDAGAAWVDIPNVLMHGAAGGDGDGGPGAVHFFKGFPRVGAYFAVPITLATVGRCSLTVSNPR